MLTPDVAHYAWSAESSKLAAAASAVYVAVTRARRRLIAPERLRDWIEQISGGGAAAKFALVSRANYARCRAVRYL